MSRVAWRRRRCEARSGRITRVVRRMSGDGACAEERAGAASIDPLAAISSIQTQADLIRLRSWRRKIRGASWLGTQFHHSKDGPEFGHECRSLPEGGEHDRVDERAQG